VDDLEHASLMHLVSLAGAVVTRRWNRLLEQQHGVSAAGLNVLLTLAGGELTHREVARRCWVRPATLTGVVDTLERNGLVRRTRSAVDRRQVLLILTPEGRGMTDRVGDAIGVEFPPTTVEQEPDHAAVVRRYLVEVIATHRDSDNSCEGR
jgi:DNA-binding MarR family transcriptional regulator